MRDRIPSKKMCLGSRGLSIFSVVTDNISDALQHRCIGAIEY